MISNIKSIFVLEFVRSIFIIFNAQLLISKNFCALFFILSLKIFVERLISRKINFLSLKFQSDLRRKIHKLIFNEVNSGNLLTLIFDCLKPFDEFFSKVLPNLFSMIILIPLILIVTLIVDPLSALIFFVTAPIAPFILYLIGNSLKIKNQKAFETLNELNHDFKEILSAITTLKIFRRTDSAISKLKSTSELSASTTLEVLKLIFVSAFALELITTLSIALIAVTIGLRLIEDEINFESALFLLIVAPEFYNPIRQIGVAFHVIIECRESINQLKKYQIGIDWSKWIRQNNFLEKFNKKSAQKK